jgi:16S rRNA A1518/A1519 N6-dimethyltransferase RsmA/KsgA/DIM1 with predicted DNA glycosylase/AP lyase activity
MLKATTKLAEGKLKEIKNWPEIFEKCKIDPKARPEKLTPDDYITLANYCFAQLS